MGGRFPEMLLPDVLDCLDLVSLLLSAMPVSRCWRGQACAHPTYWRKLAYTGRDGQIELSRGELHNAEVPKHLGSRDLFLLRLSRTYGRPIDVSVRWADKETMGTLTAHLPHVRSLSVESLVRHWEATVDTLRCSPAPLLESLSLLVHYQLLLDSDWEYHPFLPCDLFASHPAKLREVRLSNVGLSSTAELPVCFSTVESLVVYNTHESVHRPLPNVFRQCKQLRKLWIYIRVTLDDPAFYEKDTWCGLDELGLHLLSSWDVLALPLSNVPRIIMTPWAAPTAVELITWLGARLGIQIPPLRRGIERGGSRYFHAEFWALGDASRRRRLIQMAFQDERSGSLTNYSLAAFQDPTVNKCIVELTLAGHNWDLLVGQRYFTTFPALEKLVIVLSNGTDSMPHTAAINAALSCPRLARLFLRASPGSDPVAVGADELCAFSRASLEAAPFPITLELHGIALSGLRPETMDGLFTQGHNGTSDQ